jgi:hypothetical protein
MRQRFSREELVWGTSLSQNQTAAVLGREETCLFALGWILYAVKIDCYNSGFFGRGEMQKEFEEAAFALQPGEVSGVIETASGVHLIERYATSLMLIPLLIPASPEQPFLHSS